jgi:hypothetical protein
MSIGLLIPGKGRYKNHDACKISVFRARHRVDCWRDTWDSSRRAEI